MISHGQCSWFLQQPASFQRQGRLKVGSFSSQTGWCPVAPVSRRSSRQAIRALAVLTRDAPAAAFEFGKHIGKLLVTTLQ
jgi:hypothetical protein